MLHNVAEESLCQHTFIVIVVAIIVVIAVVICHCPAVLHTFLFACFFIFNKRKRKKHLLEEH